MVSLQKPCVACKGDLQRVFAGNFDGFNECERNLSESEAVVMWSVSPLPPPLPSAAQPRPLLLWHFSKLTGAENKGFRDTFFHYEMQIFIVRQRVKSITITVLNKKINSCYFTCNIESELSDILIFHRYVLKVNGQIIHFLYKKQRLFNHSKYSYKAITH